MRSSCAAGKHALSRPQREVGGPEQARRGEQLGSYSLPASERAERLTCVCCGLKEEIHSRTNRKIVRGPSKNLSFFGNRQHSVSNHVAETGENDGEENDACAFGRAPGALHGELWVGGVSVVWLVRKTLRKEKLMYEVAIPALPRRWEGGPRRGGRRSARCRRGESTSTCRRSLGFGVWGWTRPRWRHRQLQQSRRPFQPSWTVSSA